jgi:hypothetical protein
MVIKAGWSQSLQSLRAQARDYITGQIVRRRTEPDAESLVGNRLGNQPAVCSVDILNTRIWEEVEHMKNRQFVNGLNLIFIISHSKEYTTVFIEA